MHYGEYACRLQVVTTFHGFDADASLFRPCLERSAEILHRRQCATETVVESVGTHGKTVLPYRHDIHTLTVGECESPVVFGHACHYIVLCERPFLAHPSVLYPFVTVVSGPFSLHFRVLHED